MKIDEKTDDGEAIVIEFRRSYKCQHLRLLIDDDLKEITCGDCKEKLNPFFAISQMMRLVPKWRRIKAASDLAREEAQKKLRTKCQHCKQITTIKTNVTDLRIMERVQEDEKNEN